MILSDDSPNCPLPLSDKYPEHYGKLSELSLSNMKGRNMAKSDLKRLAGGAISVSILLALSGCQKPPERLNAPPQGPFVNPTQMQEHYVNMTDNAMLADMAVAPVHFIPHSSELNSLGARRLKRYSEILRIYGGTLRYEPGERDIDLREERPGEIKRFLVSCGLDDTQFAVTSALPGGRGMNAGVAIEIRKQTGFGGDTRLTGAVEQN
jgi:hypothetical protein